MNWIHSIKAVICLPQQSIECDLLLHLCACTLHQIAALNYCGFQLAPINLLHQPIFGHFFFNFIKGYLHWQYISQLRAIATQMFMNIFLMKFVQKFIIDVLNSCFIVSMHSFVTKCHSKKERRKSTNRR